MLVQPLPIHKVPTFAEQFRAAASSLVKALATLRLEESKLSMKTTPWPRKKSEGFRISMSKLDMRMSRNKKQHMWIYSKQQQWGFHQKTGVATDVSPPIWSLDWLKLLHLWKLNPHVMFAGEITSIIELQSTCLLQNSFILINYHFLVHITDIPGFIATFPSTFHHYRKNTVNPLNHSQIHWLIIVFSLLKLPCGGYARFSVQNTKASHCWLDIPIISYEKSLCSWLKRNSWWLIWLYKYNITSSWWPISHKIFPLYPNKPPLNHH